MDEKQKNYYTHVKGYINKYWNNLNIVETEYVGRIYGSPCIFLVRSSNHGKMVYMSWDKRPSTKRGDIFIRTIFIRGLDYVVENETIYILMKSLKDFNKMIESYTYNSKCYSDKKCDAVVQDDVERFFDEK